jgi:hypothetical protein
MEQSNAYLAAWQHSHPGLVPAATYPSPIDLSQFRENDVSAGAIAYRGIAGMIHQPSSLISVSPTVRTSFFKV